MPVYPEKAPHYFEDTPIENLLMDVEEAIATTREVGRDMDNGKAMMIMMLQ